MNQKSRPFIERVGRQLQLVVDGHEGDTTCIAHIALASRCLFFLVEDEVLPCDRLTEILKSLYWGEPVELGPVEFPLRQGPRSYNVFVYDSARVVEEYDFAIITTDEKVVGESHLAPSS